MDVTRSVEALCAQLGVEPVWSEMNRRTISPLMIRFVALAGKLQAGMDLGGVQQDGIAAVLEEYEPPEFVTAYGRAAVETAQWRDEAVAAARELLGDLLVAGLVR